MKLAFCFMSYGDVTHREVWEPFFKGATPDQYSVYLHRADRKTFSWIPGCTIIPHMKTAWGTFSLVQVQQELFTTAYKDKGNIKFILLSGDSIPLYSFAKIYEALTRDDKGYLEDEPGNSVHKSRERTAKRNGWPFPWHWRVSSQWSIFNRSHIGALKEYWSMLVDVFGSSSIPDEHMYITFFKGMGCMDSFHKKSAVYVNWCTRSKPCPDRIAHRPEPVTYHDFDFTPVHVGELYRSGKLFLRKICEKTKLTFNWELDQPLQPFTPLILV